MKQFCSYAVIDIQTGFLLSCGQKWKNFDGGEIRYIESGKFKTFPFFGRTITEYFRTLEINGNACAIVYWARNRGKRLCNFVTLSGLGLRLRGRDMALNINNTPETYRRLLRVLGVTYENF